MKPFDIELAKAGHKVQTRDGRPVRIICYDAKNLTYPIIALVSKLDNTVEVPESYCIDGKYDSDDFCSGLDLVMAQTKKEGWVNIYPNFSGSTRIASVAGVYATQQEAIEAKTDSYITTTKIEWEE